MTPALCESAVSQLAKCRSSERCLGIQARGDRLYAITALQDTAESRLVRFKSLRGPENHISHMDIISSMKRLTLLLVNSMTLVILTVGARCQAPAPIEALPVGEEIHQLFVDDGNDRGGGGPVALYGTDWESRDAVRRTLVRKLLAAGKIVTARDFHDAAYIFQHGQESSDYLLAHILAIEAVVKGDASSKWISAATLDRYLQAIGQKQVFGTQYLTKVLVPDLRSASAVSAPSKKIHTQEPYDKALMPDPLRLNFCVPDVAQQQLNLKEFEAGRYPAAILPAGCTR